MWMILVVIALAAGMLWFGISGSVKVKYYEEGGKPLFHVIVAALGGIICIMLVAGTVLTYNGVKIVIRNREKIGGAIAMPFVWIKNLLVKLIKAFARIFSSKKKVGESSEQLLPRK